MIHPLVIVFLSCLDGLIYLNATRWWIHGLLMLLWRIILKTQLKYGSKFQLTPRWFSYFTLLDFTI